MSKTAPKAQFLVTEDNVLEVVNKIYVKKKDIKDPRIIDSIRHLCQINKQHDPVVQLAIFLARKEVLENACAIYIETEQEVLFEESNTELNIILEMLEKHTITR
jgi:hypothetical protein